MKTMNKSFYVKVFLAFIVCNGLQSQTNGFEMSSILDGLVSTSVCSLLSIDQLRECSQKLDEEIRSSQKWSEEYSKRGVCCAINHMKDCVLEAIGDKCGNNAKTSAETIVTGAVSVLKSIPASCDAYPYGSPLCYSDIILVLISIGFVVLLALMIWLLVKLCNKCCCSYRSHQTYSSANVVLIPVESNQRISTF